MDRKFQALIKRRNVDELKSYFEALPDGKPLNFPDEKLLLAQADNELAVMAYFKKFPFSDEAVKLFLNVASEPMRRSYINRYGLPWGAQKYVIDNKMTAVASDFTQMHFFDDVDYLLSHANPEMIRMHISKTKLNKEAQVLKLLHNENSSLFIAYVAKGYFISDKVIKVVIEEHKVKALKAILSRQHRQFKKLAKKHDIDDIRKNFADEAILSEELQVAVLEDFNALTTEFMLMCSPLFPKAQEFVITRNFDAYLLKIHVSSLYGQAGYRFDQKWEPALFKALSLKGMDDCLMQFCQQDDVVFVRYASAETAIKFIKSCWLSDEAQVVLMQRGNSEIINAFISRFTPEHGMCQEAEVEMVKICSPDTIKRYVSFHTMCREALELLHKKCLEVFNYYFTVHPY